MTNTKENKLDQMKQDLGDIQLDAKSLKIEIPEDDIKDDRLILTEVVKGNDSENNFSNSEILSELRKLQSCLDSQQETLSYLLKKME
tara:strand:+ start:625 stop:885 length:261 start_codon:yes stop_codon:yes gene_type:complete